MISRDEGDVGDVFSTSSEEDMSDTQAEIGSASSDNPTLPELDEVTIIRFNVKHGLLFDQGVTGNTPFLLRDLTDND